MHWGDSNHLATNGVIRWLVEICNMYLDSKRIISLLNYYTELCISQEQIDVASSGVRHCVSVSRYYFAKRHLGAQGPIVLALWLTLITICISNYKIHKVWDTIANAILLDRWSLGMFKQLYPIYYWSCDYLPLLVNGNPYITVWYLKYVQWSRDSLQCR